MGCNPLGAILVLGLISASQLWEGVHCQGYSIDVPRAVSVQEGLCVVIHCNFTYPKSDPSFTGKLYGYWYENGNHRSDSAFATNDEGKVIVPGARGRFRLSDNLEEGDCSLFITDAQPSDQKDYFFRMQKGDGYNFYPTTSVIVEETPIPEIQIPGKLQAGQPVNMTCAAASCPWKAPNISWEFTRNISGILSSSSNGTKLSSFVPSFEPSAADNGQNLSCRVTYGSGSTTVISEKTVLLNVREAQNVILTESTIVPQTENANVPFVLGLSLVKVVFCFSIFSFVTWFSNRRKPPVMREGTSD